MKKAAPAKKVVAKKAAAPKAPGALPAKANAKAVANRARLVARRAAGQNGVANGAVKKTATKGRGKSR